MNTFAAMKPAPRPAEAVAIRSGAEAVEASADGVAEAFGAVLGALQEGRPAKETAGRADRAGDEAASGAGPAPAEPANPLLGLVVAVDTGTVPQPPATTMDPAALQALLARAVPGAVPAPVLAPAVAPRATAGSDQAVSAQGAAVPVGVADLAAGIALAAGGSGQVRSGPVQTAPMQDGPTRAVSVEADAVSRTVAESRPQVTILQQETHFAPVRPRLVAGQAAALPASAGQAGAIPAPVAPAPILPTLAAAVADAVPAREAALPLGAAVGAGVAAVSAPTSAPAAAPSAIDPTVPQAVAPVPQAGAPVPPAGSLPAPSAEPSGKPRRAEAAPATTETATVASPTVQRLAGQALPVEAAQSTAGDVLTAEAGPRETIAPVATAPAGTLPSAALGEPVRQVAEAVAAELARPAATATTAAATPGTEGPLRLLTIQLRPMDLGTVLVRMRLRDGQLEMSLHASREETAALLRQDGALLTDLLRNSGYQPDTITIASNGAGAPSQGEGGRPGAGTSFQPGGQGGQAQGGANPDQAPRRGGDTHADERADLTHERTHETISSGPDRSGLYL
ncbi:flagellar hook-length control protein FliK [Methylobacterium sp. Leaf100]|uniref:flagellar hook-length control protein FliK n=1 Tax=Methylobacterium sp. Leaf100 TaxID=1736252 RepID=UPI0006FDB19F|nr:flagellar hook-length control protein FliK [Methylobacterium sp. Leaf100]KQP36800.1 hypothetical protein ASF25_02325 [Methylobacterium sp. Leaf100]